MNYSQASKLLNTAPVSCSPVEKRAVIVQAKKEHSPQVYKARTTQQRYNLKRGAAYMGRKYK